MSFAVENPVQTPSSGRVASGGIMEPPLLVVSFEDTPDSQVSIRSQASHDFWGAEQQSRDDEPLTPTTPLSPGSHQIRTYLSTPQSARLKKSKSDSRLSTYAFDASKFDIEKRGRPIKTEPDDNKRGWLFGEFTARLHPNEHLKDHQSPKRASSATRLDSTGADFWETGIESKRLNFFEFNENYQHDFDFSRPSTPLREADPRVLNSGSTACVTTKHRQAFRTRSKKTESAQIDSPTPSPSKGGRPHRMEVRQLMTGSEAEVTVESKPTGAEDALVQVQQHSDSSVRIQGKEIHQWTNEINHGVSESDLSERRSTSTTASSSTLSKILPFNVQERLSENPHIYVASCVKRRPGQRCSKKAKGPPEAVTKYLNSLSDIDARSDHRKIFQCIEGLINSALCKSGQHMKIATRELETWRISLDRLSRNPEHAKSQGEYSSAELTAFTVWIKALTGAVLSAETHVESVDQVTFSDRTPQAISRIQISSADSSTEVTEARKVTSVEQDSAIITTTVQRRKSTRVHYRHSVVQEFRPYLPKSTSRVSVHQALRNLLTRPLSDHDLNPGKIYIYWSPPNFGYVKIGITGGDVNKRLEQWRRQCKHEAEGHNLEDLPRQVAVPHAFRVEALVHAELRGQRYQEVACKGCGRSHKEWFCVKLEHAVSVVKKWSDWMMKSPYEKDSQRRGLKASIGEDEIRELCRPLRQDTPAPAVKPSGWKQLRRSSRSTAGKRRVS